MFPRDAHVLTVVRWLDQFPVVMLLGVRQVRKASVACMVTAQAGGATRFDHYELEVVKRTVGRAIDTEIEPYAA
ncbi:MAG: hypothetical protein ACM3ST_14445 [Bdellovibrio bacteriovorus]